MKKIIISILMCLCLFGCSCDKTVKVKIDYESMPQVSESSNYLYEEYGLLSYELKTKDELTAKINDKDNFLLFVYEEDCSGCMLLAPALKAYLDEHPMVIYTMSISTMKKHSYYKEQNINSTPYLVLIKEGEIAYKEIIVLSMKQEDVSKNEEKVEAWMNDHVIWEE